MPPFSNTASNTHLDQTTHLSSNGKVLVTAMGGGTTTIPTADLDAAIEALEDANYALQWARATIFKRMGTTNAARENAIASTEAAAAKLKAHRS